MRLSSRWNGVWMSDLTNDHYGLLKVRIDYNEVSIQVYFNSDMELDAKYFTVQLDTNKIDEKTKGEIFLNNLRSVVEFEVDIANHKIMTGTYRGNHPVDNGRFMVLNEVK
jgi:hypothetical protein